MLKSFILLLIFYCGGIFNQNIVESNVTVDAFQTIDLLELRANGGLEEKIEVLVSDDPVYHKAKRYLATPMLPILKTIPDFDKINKAETKIVFECEDGYKPEMSLEKFLSAPSFIAQSDLDAPKGSNWEKITKEGHEMKADPFYIIYQGVSAKDYEFKWPYNVVKIHLAPLHENDKKLVPDDKKMMVGYKLYVKHCQICHAINNVGGNMGPELNYPKSVTSYWKRPELIDFIVNPASFRTNVKMPKPSISKAQSEQIVTYLEYMARKK